MRILLTALFVLSLPAIGHAKKVTVNVLNCLDGRLVACSYNGKDNTKTTRAGHKVIPKQSTAELKCKGQGKNMCKIGVKRMTGNMECNTLQMIAVKDKTWLKVIWDGTKIRKSEHKTKPTCHPGQLR